ncbi:lipopolysaccharide biosynthesis protein [Parabacteroides pacaensis]|uniref:lipopolysaccharide biosynthesis protein n=1 Tax=Parabacteroides pacaensis TaxID=2086575 RepID=UPI000D1107DB|nr:lipopolysaccharide biosynthesis protein [Parabacteroides pacaensis]
MVDRNIKQTLVKGTFYTALAKYSGVIVSLLISSILARLLTPKDFASVTIITLIIWFFNIFSEAGFGAAIIHKKELSKNVLINIYSYTIYLGLIFTFFAYYSSTYIGTYYRDESLIKLCKIFSINIFFATANVVPNALIYKNKLFKFIALRTLFFNVLGGILGVTAALYGWGVYSLLVAPMLTSVGVFIVNYMKYPMPFHLFPNLKSLFPIFSFSLYQFIYYIINYFTISMDKFVIGRYVGMKDLGYYDKPYRLMTIPIENITHVITPVLLPVFAEYQNDKPTVLEYYLKILHFLAYIGFYLSVLLFFTAKELIIIVFGNQWYPSIPIFEILAFSISIRMMLSSIVSVYQSMGATKLLLYTGIIAFLVQTTSILIWYIFSKTLIAIAWTMVGIFVINFIQSYMVLFYCVFQEPINKLFRQLYSPFLFAILLFFCLYGINYVIHMELFLSLVIKVLFSGIFFFIYLRLIGEYDIIKKVFLWKRKKCQ